jgi:hypothetical protein
VRGAYRRQKGGQKAVEEEANQLSEEEDLSESGSTSDDGSDVQSITSFEEKGKAKETLSQKRPRGRPKKNPLSAVISPTLIAKGKPTSKSSPRTSPQLSPKRTTLKTAAVKKSKVGSRKLHTSAGKDAADISDVSLEYIDISSI